MLTSLKTLTLRRDKSQRNVALIETPQDIDILLGRSKEAFSHVGNRRFRVFILMHLKDYMNANSRGEKTLVANNVYEQISDAGGRFLQQDAKTEKWIQVTHKVGRDKVGHALRDAVGKRVQMSSSGNQEGYNGQKPTFNAKRTSEVAIANFKRNSVVDRPRPGIVVAPRFSRSCNDLNPDDAAAIKSTMALNAAQACHELHDHVNDEDEDDNGAELGPGGSSELMFESLDLSFSKRSIEPTPMHSAAVVSRAGEVRKQAKPSAQNGTSVSGSPAVEKSLQDDRSAELSVMSEGTTKKWYELAPSSEFSDASVDTDVFDDVDGNAPNAAGFPRHLVEKVNARLNLEGSGVPVSSSRKKGESVPSRRKIYDKVTKRATTDTVLSEEFSIMSLDKRDKFENEDVGFKSEDFGLSTEEFTKGTTGHGGLKSDELCLNADEYRISTCDASIFSDFSARSSAADSRNSGFDIDVNAMRVSSSDMSIGEAKISNISDAGAPGPSSENTRLDFKPRISWALDDQPRGLMYTVLEGSPLGDRNGTYREGCDERNSGRDANLGGVASLGKGQLAAAETSEPMRDSISSEFGLKLSEWGNRSLESLLEKEVDGDDRGGTNEV